jgi:hypothetical protein
LLLNSLPSLVPFSYSQVYPGDGPAPITSPFSPHTSQILQASVSKWASVRAWELINTQKSPAHMPA